MGQYKHHVSVCTSGHGPMVVVYPEDVWCSRVDEVGALEIVRQHLQGGAPVEACLCVAPPGDNKIAEGEPQI